MHVCNHIFSTDLHFFNTYLMITYSVSDQTHINEQNSQSPPSWSSQTLNHRYLARTFTINSHFKASLNLFLCFNPTTSHPLTFSSLALTLIFEVFLTQSTPFSARFLPHHPEVILKPPAGNFAGERKNNTPGIRK